jgi:hypothetical protein
MKLKTLDILLTKHLDPRTYVFAVTVKEALLAEIDCRAILIECDFVSFQLSGRFLTILPQCRCVSDLIRLCSLVALSGLQ